MSDLSPAVALGFGKCREGLSAEEILATGGLNLSRNSGLVMQILNHRSSKSAALTSIRHNWVLQKE